jgi:Guanosine polyphosphate pyrophosphohydrolases/synthetases
MLEKAILIATNAHQGQVDKAGKPYILHPLRLMFSRQNETERICAVLHDVIEDTDITLDYLRNQGFSEEVLAALEALTRRSDETYDEFISRIINNRIACYVKLADLCDNMDLSRIENPSEKDYIRIQKYRKAADRILGALDEIGDREFAKTKKIEVNGCVSVPEGCSEGEFSGKFIEFVERNNWAFVGGINGFTNNDSK